MAGGSRRSGPKQKAKAKPKARQRRVAGAGTAIRSRLVLLGAVVVSAIVLFAWFPAGSLLNQRSNLAGTEAQLATLHKQDAALAQEKKNLSDATEIGRIAREQYQLVSPGQQAYEVLPPAGGSTASSPYAGDPGLQAPAAPSSASALPPGSAPASSQPTVARHAGTTRPPSGPVSTAPGVFTRMLDTLEFWR